MASQPVIQAAARESRANAREDMAVLTSGAREKVDGTMASMKAFGQTLLHPMDKQKRQDAQAAAEEQKKAAQEKRDEIRGIAAQQGGAERAAARGSVGKAVSDVGGARYPVPSVDQPQQSTGPHGGHVDAAVNEPQQSTGLHGGHADAAGDQPQQSTGTHGGHVDAAVNQPQQPTGPHDGHVDVADNQPDHPSIVDEPFESSNAPIVSHANDEVEVPHNQNLMSGSDTHTAAPKPVGGLSRDSQSGEHTEDVDAKGVEDADFYPPPQVVQT